MRTKEEDNNENLLAEEIRRVQQLEIVHVVVVLSHLREAVAAVN